MIGVTRRNLLASLGAVPLLAAGIPARGDAAGSYLVVINLRGALDGLAALPPHADPDYRRARGDLALAGPSARGVIDLDGSFGLHPALAPLRDFFRRGEMLVMPATGFQVPGVTARITPGTTPGTTAGITRGRMPVLTHATGQALIAESLAPTNPVARAALPTSWRYDPAQLDLIADLCHGNPSLQESLGSLVDGGGLPAAFTAQAQSFIAQAGDLGSRLADGAAPRLSMLESHGWDTHADQGRHDGRLATALVGLAEGITALAAASGRAWRRISVLVVSEFGRTVAMNAMGGTDHGSASVTLLLGGAVAGGRIVARWPGLAPEQRDESGGLRATRDLGAILAAVLRHLDGAPGPVIGAAPTGRSSPHLFHA